MGVQIPVETGIPVPQPVANAGKYPFSQCNVNDSFFLPTTDTRRRQKLVQTAASKWRKRTGKTARFRSDAWYDQNGNIGVRVWRVA